VDKLTNKKLRINSGITTGGNNFFANSQAVTGTGDLWNSFKMALNESETQDIQSQIKQIQQQKEEYEKISILPYGQKLNLVG
jgi:hypothetical protein